MTEREKRIEEMAKIKNRCLCDCGKCVQCSDYVLSTLLYNADYRKSDEVRKETAQKIWDELFAGSILMMLDRCDYNAKHNEMADEIRRVFKKFGTKIAKIDQ